MAKRYTARVVQHRTMDFVVESETPAEAASIAEEKAAKAGRDWEFAEPVYECASLHEAPDIESDTTKGTGA